MRYARRAIDILERTENDSYVAMAYHALAYAEIEAGNAESALVQIERGRELLGADLTDQADAQFSLEETRALLALGRLREAATAAGNAFEKLHAVDRQDQGRGYMLLGEVFAANGDRDRARGLYELAVDSCERDARPFLAEAARRLADLLEAEGRADEALAVLKRAIGHDRAATPAPAPVE